MNAEQARYEGSQKKRMNVLYHTDWLVPGRGYGLSRYSQEMFRALRKQDPAMRMQPVAVRGGGTSGSRPIRGAAGDEGSIQLSFTRARILSWAALRMPVIEAAFPKADLVHSVELDYPVATRLPWIATVHDLGPLTHPQYFAKSRPWLKRLAIKEAIRGAAAIVAVSQATADAIEELAGCRLRSRLHVVHEGVAAEFHEPAPMASLQSIEDQLPRDAPYFLWTGSLNPRKNIKNVLRAFERVANRFDHHLVLAGGLGWSAEEVLAEVSQSQVRARIHRPGRVSDEQLRALYAGATGFVYASLMEGFGLPILEAMASGCPVITSNLSSMPEVAGDAALLVDPTDPDAIAEAMLQLATSSTLHRAMVDRGRVRSRRLTWERAAVQMAGIYEKVLDT